MFALGQSVILLAEEIYKGNMTPDKIEEAIEFIAKQLKNNAVLNKAIDFITENFEKFSKKTAKEVFTITMNTIKNLGPKSEENYSLLSENEESGN